MNLLEIFRAGKHVAQDGTELTFSEAQLKAAAEAYDPAVHEAPLVIGHPKTDDPAWGWVKSLAFAEGKLNALPHQVDPKFAELVTAGRFKKLSASFYLPDSGSNPKPGVFYLRHVGFLGAQPPALKGLKTASFRENETGVVTLEFGEVADATAATMWRRMRDWFLSKFGIETADQVLPDYLVKTLEREAEKPSENAPVPTVAGFSEPHKEELMDPKNIANQQAELDRQKADFDKQKADFAETQKQLAKKQNERAAADFVEGLVKAGKVLPAQRDSLVGIMAGMPVEQIVEFGEGDKRVSKPAIELFKQFLTDLPKQVDFGEIAKPDGSIEPLTDATEIAKKAVEYQETELKAGRTISVSQAVAFITKGAK